MDRWRVVCCAAGMVVSALLVAPAQAKPSPPEGYRWSLASREVVIYAQFSDPDRQALNPAQAETDGLSASVRVGCIAQEGGTLAECELIDLEMSRNFRPMPAETPDPGFAAAALKLAERTRVIGQDTSAAPAPGDLVIVRSEWPFRYEPMPPGFIGVSPSEFAQVVRAVPAEARLAPEEIASLPYVRMADFSRVPDQPTMQRVAPVNALRTGAMAQVRLLCRVDESGALSACAAVEETPAELGFGSAAVSVAPQFQVRPERARAALREHQGYVRLVLRWRGG